MREGVGGALFRAPGLQTDYVAQDVIGAGLLMRVGKSQSVFGHWGFHMVRFMCCDSHPTEDFRVPADFTPAVLALNGPHGEHLACSLC